MKKYCIILTMSLAFSFILASTSDHEPAGIAQLGRLLFFDSILSRDLTVSCASCHKPEYAFADTTSVSTGVNGKKGTRNTPSAMNVLLGRFFFWDGRSKSLEEQALAPIENPVEMNLPLDSALQRLRRNKSYQDYFKKVFNEEPTRDNLAAAIAAFERTLETSDSPFDDWKFSDNPNAVNASVKNGFILFSGKAKCSQCHFGADFTQHEFRNIGLFNGRDLNDSGRIVISGKKEDLGRFKTPSLRNVAITGPYMHNGMFKTLDELIDFYNDPGKVVPRSINRDSVLAKPLGLNRKERSDIKQFLLALTDKRFDNVQKKR